MNKTILFCTVIFLSAFSYSQVDSGLVAKYTFNDGTAADAIGTNDGTVNGAELTTDRFGNPSMAFNFINGDYISLPDAAVLKSDTMTVSLWVKIDSFAVSNVATNYIYSVINSPTAPYFVSFGMTIGTGDYKYFSIAQDGPTESVYGSSIDDTTSAWQHYVVSIDNDSIKMYIDGVNQWSYLKDFTTDYTTDLIYIGASGNSTYYGNLNGSVDDIRIYNHVLSATQVDSLFNEQDPLFGAGLSNEKSFDFNVYPNPANHQITLVSGVPSAFNVINMQGEVVANGYVQQSTIVDISFLSSGIYFIQTQNGNAVKFIKN